jgi:hypothetical protein
MKNGTERSHRFLLLFALFLLCGPAGFFPAVHAQETRDARGGEGFFYFEKTGDKVRFIQHLAWESSEHAYRYEITIEKQNPAGFSLVVNDFTREPFIEVSLNEGHYRYRIVVYDLFDIPGEPSAWTEFEVYPALSPRITTFRPEAFWLDEEMEWTLFLEGQNFTQRAEVYLRPQEPGGAIIPLQYIPASSGTSARLVFDKRTLTPGVYEVYIKNPGGLESALGIFRIAYHNLSELTLSFEYGPLIPLYGDLNTFFDKPIFPLGAAVRIGFVPFKREWGYLGLELAPFWAYLSTSDEGYEAAAQYLGAHVNGLFQKWIHRRIMAFNFRLGAGLALLDNLHFEFSTETTEPLQTLMPSLDAGFSFIWFVNEPFFLELGVEYLHFFSVDPSSPGYLRPILGGGCRF